MESTINPFTPLLVVVLLAFLVPVVLARFKKLRLPIVVGEILAGILIGRSGLGWVSPDEPILEFIAEFGFVLLMFISGMEIDFSNLSLAPGQSKSEKATPWGPLPLAIISFGLTLALAAGISFGLVALGLTRNAWMMGLILSTTSLGVVVPVLKENGVIGSQFGQSILLSALIADFVTMFLITILVTVLSHGLTFDILLTGLLFVAFFVLLRFGKFFNRLPAARRTFNELSHTTAQIKVRAAFAVMLAFVVLSTALGTEIILGAFLAGACVALLKTPQDEQITHQLETVGYGFLIPVFFIKVGVDFNLSAITDSPKALLLVPILIIAALAVKLLPALIFRLRFNWRESISAGILLSARLSLIIAAAAVSVRLEVITESTNSAILLMAILMVTLAPPLFSLIAQIDHAEKTYAMIVAGAGELGIQVAEQLQRHKETVIIIDDDNSRIERARERGFDARAVNLELNNSEAETILNHAKTLICTDVDPERCFNICRAARVVHNIPHIVTQVPTPGDITRYELIKVSAINAAIDHAALLTMVARNPAIYELLTRADDDKEVYELQIENHAWDGIALRELNLPGDTLVLAVRRNGDLLVPHGNTQLELGDYITLVSSCEWIEACRNLAAYKS